MELSKVLDGFTVADTLVIKAGRRSLKPSLKAPVSMLLKLRYDGPLSNCAFNFNLRHYIKAQVQVIHEKPAGAHTRPILTHT
jgi:hypothetical protein